MAVAASFSACVAVAERRAATACPSVAGKTTTGVAGAGSSTVACPAIGVTACRVSADGASVPSGLQLGPGRLPPATTLPGRASPAGTWMTWPGTSGAAGAGSGLYGGGWTGGGPGAYDGVPAQIDQLLPDAIGAVGGGAGSATQVPLLVLPGSMTR